MVPGINSKTEMKNRGSRTSLFTNKSFINFNL